MHRRIPLLALVLGLFCGLDAFRLLLEREPESHAVAKYQPQLNMPVFLHGTSKKQAAGLVEFGVYSKNDVAKLGQGLYTTAYLPQPSGDDMSEETLLSGAQGTYREYVWRAKHNKWDTMPRLVGFQLHPGHDLKIAVVPRRLHKKEPANLDASCRGFDAFCVPDLVDTVASGCHYLKTYVDSKSSCTALSIEEVLAAISQDCIQEVKWNWVDGEAKLPELLHATFLATNNPYTPADQIISFFGLGTKEARDTRVILAKEWSDLVDWSGVWASSDCRYRLLVNSKEQLLVKVYKGNAGKKLEAEDLRSDEWVYLTCRPAAKGPKTGIICQGQYTYQHHRGMFARLAQRPETTLKAIQFELVGDIARVQDTAIAEGLHAGSENEKSFTQLKRLS